MEQTQSEKEFARMNRITFVLFCFLFKILFLIFLLFILSPFFLSFFLYSGNKFYINHTKGAEGGGKQVTQSDLKALERRKKAGDAVYKGSSTVVHGIYKGFVSSSY
jgi:hypothetical protein